MSDEECPLCRFGDRSWRQALPQWIANLSVSCAVLSENQICRGYTIVAYAKGHATEFFHLKRKEQIAYMEDVTRVAKAIDDAFHPYKLNYELNYWVIQYLTYTGMLSPAERQVLSSSSGLSGGKIMLRSLCLRVSVVK